MKSRQRRYKSRSRSKRSSKYKPRVKKLNRIKKITRSKTNINSSIKNRNITYVPSNKKFILNQHISSHQRNIFLKNKINNTLSSVASSKSSSCSSTLCSGK